jgi:hypothetical protein
VTAREVLDGIKAEAKGLTDLCAEHLRQSIRHVQRNCDIDCNTHEDDYSECHQPERSDGERMAKSLGNIARLTAALEAVLARADRWDEIAGARELDNLVERDLEIWLENRTRSFTLRSTAHNVRAAIEGALKEGQ